MNARDRTGAAALVGASVTGLIAFALFLAGALLLWANHHYKDDDGFLTTGGQRFESSAYAVTTSNLEIGAGAPGFLLKADRYGTIRLETMAKGGKPLFVGMAHDRGRQPLPGPLRRTAKSPTSTSRPSRRRTRSSRARTRLVRPASSASGRRRASTR